jgi:calcineurin-like phosphoesterase family protein
MSKTYFTADLHLGHGRIIEYCGRPFGSTQEMDVALMDNWNGLVTDGDTVYILGDFSWGRHDEYGRFLRGKKYLVPGNHDRIGPAKWLTHLTILPPIFIINYAGMRFVLCHYPMMSWPGSGHGSILLFGHVHNSLSAESAIFEYAKNRPMFNVGVDVNDYKPVSADDILKKMSAPGGRDGGPNPP